MNLNLAQFRRRIVFRVVLLAFVGLTAVVGRGTSASATTFQPSWNVSLANSSPGVSSDVILEFGIPAPDPNFSKLISIVPPEFDIADGDSIPNGAFSGSVTSTANLGLIGNSCSSSLQIEFQLMDASTDPSVSIPPYNGTTDGNGNGLPDNVDYYPALMSMIAPNTEPLQRLYGQSPVSGTLIPLNFLIFAPGTPIPLLPAFDSSLGYLTVAIVGDPFAVPETGFPVTDFCTPLSTTVVLNGVSVDKPSLPGNQGGYTLRTNPPEAGVYNSIIFARSQWDTDGDGIENNIDPCALTPDPNWNPRVDAGPGDADDDGLPDSCDPSSAFNFDNDGDQYPNRGDYCPTVAADYIHWDQDHDAIGDDCDPFPMDDTNGGVAQRQVVCVADTIVVGSPALPDPPAWTCPDGPDLQVPPRMNLYSFVYTQLVGTALTMVVEVSTPGLAPGPAEGVTVDFLVTGANPTSGSCLTDPTGICQFDYVGANEGTDTITATATVDGFTIDDAATTVWVLPPPNDDFSAAMPVTSLPFEDDAVMMGATLETGEPRCGSGGTLWYSFSPAETAYVVVGTATQWASTSIGAYEGSSFDDLQRVACREPPGHAGTSPAGAYVGFEAIAGQTYYIQVVTADPFGDLIQVRIDYATPGDANCSTDLTALDALHVLRTVAGLPAADCAANGDINCDDAVNAIDALMILRVVADIVPPPGGCLFAQG